MPKVITSSELVSVLFHCLSATSINLCLFLYRRRGRIPYLGPVGLLVHHELQVLDGPVLLQKIQHLQQAQMTGHM